MRLTTKGEYAVRALIYLLQKSEEGPVQIREISDSESMSKSYIEQLFNKMRKAGLIKSSRGSRGGYVLGKSPKKITIGDIIRCVEGPIYLTLCSGSGGNNCSRASSCKSYPMWKKINEKLESALDSVNLGDLK
ncbi:MAG: Rrf2 family transcriptional regulator [Candidatus Saganbacteria bacterium]|nr:Rrf2 family transcriptional regulator [Candidatus Saganbacteria bacterium]